MNLSHKLGITFGLAAILAVGVNSVHSRFETPPQTVVEVIKEAQPNQTMTQDLKQIVKTTRIITSADNVIALFGPVDESSSAHVIAELDKRMGQTKDIYLLIDSPGGSVFAGTQVIDAIEGNTNRIHTVCVSLCASMAAQIFEIGHTRLMFKRAMVMFHPAAGGVQGELENMESRLKMIRTVIDKLDLAVSKRAGIELEKFKLMLRSELWLDGEDAAHLRFADGIVYLTIRGGLNMPPNSENHIKKFFNVE